MVVVRESPRTKISPDKNNTQWPPKSPFQALLSSPSGRKKWQDRGTRERERSTSPSPMKNTQHSSRALQAMAGGSEDEMEDLDEEERQAQLELAAIEAKLKLEKIRQRKKLAAASGENAGSSRAASGTDSVTTSPRKSLRPSLSQPDLRRAHVEVPLSPLQNRIDPAEQLSPARRRLGLNSSALAGDVSLKRARDGSQIKRSESSHNEMPRPSFNDRLRATQQRADDQEAKHDRIERVRNKGFDKVVSSFGEVARKVEQGTKGSEKISNIASVRETRGTPRQTRDASTTSSRPSRCSEANAQAPSKSNGLFQSINHKSNELPDNSSSNISKDNETSNEITSTPSYETFSELHLTRRHLPHVDIARAMEDKEIYTLPRLLKEVTAPSYDPPDCESDWVVFAIVASKSSPYDQKQSHRTSDEGKPQDDALAPRNKFMVLKLCDLKWEVDCFLFGTAFDQFWKLTPGTLLAILNPDIMPPKTNQHSGRFSLKLGSSEDCVMEKDGQHCGEWIDKRSTEICEFHLNLFIEKQRKGRMEVNGMWRGTSSGDSDSRAKSRSREAGVFDKQMRTQQQKGKGGVGSGITQSREFGTLYSVNTGSSAADLLDAEDRNQLNGWAEHEASRKRIAAKEEERKLQRTLAKLGDGGDSVGAACLRDKTGLAPTMSLEAKALFQKPKAADLGLLGNKASTTHLSPSKERKKHFGLGALTTSGRDAIGWGGARKVESALLKPSATAAKRLASPERGQTRLDPIRPPAIRARSQDGSAGGSLSSPTKKRARFLLAEKGLREPGRESGGVELKLNEDDDDLDIV
ncbi:hypothetical protein LTR78_000963 [Recurvomyces mirabilis]|uniref:Zinc finger Mcm10/DnaG-type domain-containing protein n=1 Tax=Recurvomyces mirabilis TaxID=574656 RepID=A0AAE1C5Z9_9PEZI|nr:hypothetical protein LTR78_000963 [Recurvomyces mirabilis]KAK5158935.1 hypothetical protein LTS14_003043 [Recurvomyces mirabilis]